MPTDTKIQNRSDQVQTSNAGLSVRSLDDLPMSPANPGAENLCILADVSGSMATEYSGGKSRMQGLQEAMTALWEITDWDNCITFAYRFSDYTYPMNFSIDQGPEVGQVMGGTSFDVSMRAALENPNLNRIILASDGQPSYYPEHQISECQNRGVTVDTIYIGTNEEDMGAQTLKRISEETGGIFTLCSNVEQLVQQMQQLETNNRLLLTHDAGVLPGPDDVIKL